MRPSITTQLRRPRWLFLLIVPVVLTACAGARTPSTSWPGVVASGDTAYVAFNQAVYAVDLEDGREQWRFAPEGDEATSFYAPPAIDPGEGVLYAGSYDGDIVALDAESGAVVWQRQVSDGRIIGGPSLAGDLLLVPSSDRQVRALRTSNGQEVWSFTSERAFWSRPYVDGDRAYLAGLDHHLYALQAESGEVIWDKELDGALADEPASFNGALLVGTFGEELNAVDKENGDIEWSAPTEDWVWGNPAVGDGAAYFGDVSGNFFAVNDGGEVLWQLSLDSGVTASPAYKDGNLFYVTEEGGVFAREAAGNDPLWQEDQEGRLLSDPVTTENGLLLVAALDGENLLTAYDAESSAIRWTYQPVED